MIYVMSDIHGNFENFESIMEKINLKPEDKLYVLGDVIDRQPYGLLILQKLMKMGNVQWSRSFCCIKISKLERFSSRHGR